MEDGKVKIGIGGGGKEKMIEDVGERVAYLRWIGLPYLLPLDTSKGWPLSIPN
jgi:hypothetical protein